MFESWWALPTPLKQTAKAPGSLIYAEHISVLNSSDRRTSQSIYLGHTRGVVTHPLPSREHFQDFVFYFFK